VNRTFRQTLLVKQGRAADIRYRLDPARIQSLEFAGVFAAEDGAPLTLDASEQSCNALRNLKVTLRLPVHKAAAQMLDAHYPASVPAEALVGSVVSATGEPRASVERIVMSMLEELLILGAVRIRRAPVRAATQVSATRPAWRCLPEAPPASATSGMNPWVSPRWSAAFCRCSTARIRTTCWPTTSPQRCGPTVCASSRMTSR
jgi:hypothetical protein